MARHDQTATAGGRVALRLRTAVLLLLVTTLLGTVLVIASAAYLSTRDSVEDLSNRYLASTTTSVRHKVDSRIRSAESLLLYLASQQEVLLTSPIDWEALGLALARVLATDEGLKWVNYGQASDGLFVGAERRADGTIIVNYSVADESSASHDYLVRDGKLIYDRPAPGGFDPRVRPWYQDAVRRGGMAWSEPYQFYAVPDLGITASLPIYEPGDDGTSRLRGVLAVDLTVAALQQFLEETRGGSASRLYILSPGGNLIAGTTRRGQQTTPTLAQLQAPAAQGAADGGSHRVLNFDGQPYATMTDRISLSGDGEVMLAVLVPTAEYLQAAQRNAVWAASIGGGALLLAIVLGYRFTHRMTRPLREVAEELDRIGRFDLGDQQVGESRIQEVNTVLAAADRMKASLRSFARYVPAELVRSLVANGSEAQLGGEVREMTLLFSDLANFTYHSESRPPDQVVKDLAEYFEAITDALAKHHGTLVQFAGDGVFAFFNAPLPVPDHPAAACHAALAAQQRLRALNEQRLAEGRLLIEQRIGLHTDRVVVGNTGTAAHLTYTAMGDGVNLASRLESLNKIYGTQLLASDAVRVQAGERFQWRQLDRVVVKGRAQPTDVYELLGETGDVTDQTLALRDAYEQALAIYLEGRFAEAADRFAHLASRFNDAASAALHARCRGYHDQPLDAWRGAAVLDHK